MCVCVYIVTGVFSNHVAVATLDIPGLRFDDSPSVPIPSSLVGLVICIRVMTLLKKTSLLLPSL